MQPGWAKVEQERDLYRRLLDLGMHEEPEPFLAQTLELVTRISGAQRGYLELHDEREGMPEECLWAIHGCQETEVPAFRGGISQGVIAEALASQATILSASASADPRFRDRGSVRRHAIQAVLCAPILAGQHSGVIYLQGRDTPGPFSEEDRVRVETFARHIAAFAERILLRQRYVKRADPTYEPRRILGASALIGSSEALAYALRQAASVATTDANVLLTGPAGSGKTLLARAFGERNNGPLIEHRCAAPEHELLEAIAAADGGALVLDDIDRLTLTAQAELLTVLQTREYRPAGTVQPRRSSLRIIATTHEDLQGAVNDGTFNERLRYRVAVFTIRMPALSERIEDIPALLLNACTCACARLQRSRLEVSPAAIVSAQTAAWPDNVGQLYRSVTEAVARVIAEDATVLQSHHLFPPRPRASMPLTYQEATRGFQRGFIQQTLEEVGWNISEGARRLDIGRTYLYRLLSSFGIERAR